MFCNIIKLLVAGLFACLTMTACSNNTHASKPLSPEAQKRIRDQEEAKKIQDRNNQMRAFNSQIQEQNRMEQLEVDRLRAQRAAQRNAEREARRAEEEKNQ
jgi:TolA-binding protein